MGNVDVSLDQGMLSSKLAFTSKGSLQEIQKVLEQVDRWGEFFPGLVLRGRMLSSSEEKGAELVLTAPLIESWTVISLYTLENDGEVLRVRGRNTDLGDWAETKFSLTVSPSSKKGKKTTVELCTESPVGSLPVPPSSLSLMLRMVKPIIKSTLHNAIKMIDR